MKVILVGGGSGGSVSPLLATAKILKNNNPKTEFLFVGGKSGPEHLMSKADGINFKSITSGKLRRYFSLSNFTTPFLIAIGFFQSFKIIKNFKPQVVFGTGSFVQVPLIWAAKLCGVKIVIHQQDIIPSLANKLCSWAANKITVSFNESKYSFSENFGFYKNAAREEKIIVTGNPFREELKEATKEHAFKNFKLHNNLPVLFITGGGTGAKALNQIVWDSLPKLTKIVQIIHQTGEGKNDYKGKFENYQAYEFIQNMGEAYAACDIVLCRAGISTLTELSNLGKIAIIVPMPNSHQEYNAELIDNLGSGFVISQISLNKEILPEIVRKILFNNKAQERVKESINKIMPHGSAKKIAQIISKLVI